MVVRKGTSDEFIQQELALYKPFFNALTCDDVVLELGANIGLVTCELAHIVETIYAFEPHPINYGILSSNCSKLFTEKNIVLFELAIICAPTKASIANSHRAILNSRLGDNQGAHTLASPRPDREHAGIEVKTLSIQHLLRMGLGLTAAKIDIEGGEEKIMRHIFSHSSIKTVLVEYHPSAWVSTSLRGILDMATEEGFKHRCLQDDKLYNTQLYLHERD